MRASNPSRSKSRGAGLAKPPDKTKNSKKTAIKNKNTIINDSKKDTIIKVVEKDDEKIVADTVKRTVGVDMLNSIATPFALFTQLMFIKMLFY